MDRRCDAFVCLPGGLGTLEELLEIWVRTPRDAREADRGRRPRRCLRAVAGAGRLTGQCGASYARPHARRAVGGHSGRGARPGRRRAARRCTGPDCRARREDLWSPSPDPTGRAFRPTPAGTRRVDVPAMLDTVSSTRRVAATWWARKTRPPAQEHSAVAANVASRRLSLSASSVSPRNFLFDTATSTGQPVATSSPSRRVTSSE